MSYYNGRDILPDDLICAIQKYFDGGYLYIPRKECNRKSWGAVSMARKKFGDRNTEIYKKYLAGTSVSALADEYFLSAKTIYSIIAKNKSVQ